MTIQTSHGAPTTSTAAPVNSPVAGTAHIVLPAFNEADSLPPLLTRLAATARTERVVVWVVDDGSSDGTGDIVAAGVPGLDLRLVTHPRNLGLGQAVQSGLRAVLDAADPDDFVVVMDADDTHDPAMVVRLRAALESGADVAICPASSRVATTPPPPATAAYCPAARRRCSTTYCGSTACTISPAASGPTG